MSYPDVSAVILDASFDDLVPLALKVMPDSWSEYSSQDCPSREGVDWNWQLFLTGDGFHFCGWGELGGFPCLVALVFSMNSGDLCVGQGLYRCHPFTFIPL